jgi:nucleotide-binding universal stress UspA family protein
MSHEYPVNRIGPYLRRSSSGTTSRTAGPRLHEAPFVDDRHDDEGTRLPGADQDFTGEVIPPFRYRSILVPVDGKSFAEHALPLALGIARRSGAEVRVVLVHRPTLSADSLSIYHDGYIDHQLKFRQLAYLDDLSRRLAATTSVPVLVELAQGREVAESLCAAGADADLVVMATHGRGPLGRFWFGSVADAVVRRADVPVLLVRGYDAPVDLTGDPLLRHVLISLDGSEFAERILQPAFALGTLTGAAHTLLRVAPFAREDSALRRGGGERRDHVDGRDAKERAYVRELAECLRGRTRRVRSRHVLDSRPTSKAIVDFARGHEVDLVALATRGRWGLSRLFRAGIADRVIRDATMPVLVFRPSS